MGPSTKVKPRRKRFRKPSKGTWIAVGLVCLFFTLIGRFVIVPVESSGRPIPKKCTLEERALFTDLLEERKKYGMSCDTLIQINTEYVEKIKPIFQEKCMNCHGSPTELPLYSFFPPASWLIRHDMSEAKEHLDMTHDFPFGGEHSAYKNFEGLMEIAENGEMPPFQYKIMHWKSGLTKEESNVIIDWAKRSQSKL